MEATSQDLKEASADFNRSSRKLARQMCMRKVRLYVVLGVFVFAVFLYFFGSYFIDDSK